MKVESGLAIIIQARLNSTRVPRKMVREFGGSTLFEIAINNVLSSGVDPENVIVSIHEKELIDIAKKYPVQIFERSEKSANADGSDVRDVLEWHNKIPYKHCVLVSACCPFLTGDTIRKFINDFLASDARGFTSVVKRKNYFWSDSGDMLTPLADERDDLDTQHSQTVLEAAHCLYAATLEDIEKQIWMGSFKEKGDPELWVMPDEKETLDIDLPWQFDWYRKIYEQL